MCFILFELSANSFNMDTGTELSVHITEKEFTSVYLNYSLSSFQDHVNCSQYIEVSFRQGWIALFHNIHTSPTKGFFDNSPPPPSKSQVRLHTFL